MYVLLVNGDSPMHRDVENHAIDFMALSLSRVMNLLSSADNQRR